uniref:PH domain-containing protein n=1 Tax=Strigamia maritima TaxID=126957 RepID=T1JHE8_STRMM
MNFSTIADEFEELLLQSARNGDDAMVRELLQAKKEKRLIWMLIAKAGANVNVVNEAGDTPLHKAAFTGREALVIMLLKYKADVSTINGEGLTPRQAALVKEVRDLIEGAEKTEIKQKEEQFLHATREGNFDLVNSLLKDPHPPNINCYDANGNTALHCCAYRDQKEIAVVLLQNGINSTLRNNQGQTALQLATTIKMRQLLDVQPIKKLVRHVARFEGPLMKRSRFLGWQNVWAVLERGVLTYFKTRADACSGVKRKGYKHLDDATAFALTLEPNVIVIHFNDNTMHRLSLPQSHDEFGVGLQKWLNALREHIDYSTYYMNQGLDVASSDEEEEHDVLPLGSMQDALKTAQAHEQLLKNEITALSLAIPEDNSKSIHKRLRVITEAAQAMMTSLNHCMTIFTQQEEVRLLQLKNEQEKCRVLQHSLHVLAKEHHELEQSMATSPFHTPKSRSARSPRFYDTSDDEFYDAFDEPEDEAEEVK